MEEVVHIVLCTYNGERYLEEQIKSLRRQTFPNFTVEICDDGSTDGTCLVAERYAERDERISLHRNERNLGYAKNFLEGVKRSSAPYIMLCDQDDIWNGDKVELTLREMKAAEKKGDGPVLVFTDAMNFDSQTGKNLGRFHETSHLDTKKVDTAHLFMENKCIGCTVMVSRDILPYLDRLPDEIRVHDWWLALICSHFGQVVYVDEATLRYRQHGDNMIGGDSYGSYIKNRLSSFKRQREVLRQTISQGRAFYELFGDWMSPEKRETAQAFAFLDQRNGLARRLALFRHGFWKSGLVRNAGLFFFI